MRKSGLINHDTQRNLPDYNKLLSKAMKNNVSGGAEPMAEKGQGDMRGTPDRNMLNEDDRDFNRNLNYRPKADTDQASNKYEHLNGKFGKTNIKNVGIKSFHADNLDRDING